MDPKKTEAEWLDEEIDLMEKAKVLFGNAMYGEQGYILSEEIGCENDDPIYTIFVGRIEQLNLYQLWYNFTNKTQLNVVAAFVPIVRVKPTPEITMIPKDELEIGEAYKVQARNFTTAIWDGKLFQGVRYKMGNHFIDSEDHWDDDIRNGTVRPIRRLE